MYRLVATLFVGLLLACGRDSASSNAVQNSSTTNDSLVRNSPVTPRPTISKIAKGGPSIRADSSAPAPRLVVDGEQNILLLPGSMARVLSDSLPGFSPRPLAAWTPAMVTTIVSENPGVVIPSVVLGDFNGDGKTDVAIEGRAGQIDATLFLIAPSDTAPKAQLLFISRGEAASRPDTEPANDYITILHPRQIVSPYSGDTLKLRTDAVQYVVIEKASIIYYLDHGVVREYSASD